MNNDRARGVPREPPAGLEVRVAEVLADSRLSRAERLQQLAWVLGRPPAPTEADLVRDFPTVEEQERQEIELWSRLFSGTTGLPEPPRR